MYKIALATSIFLVCILSSCGSILNIITEGVSLDKSDSKPISHETWTSLLKQHVSHSRLDYEGIIKDSILFQSYLDALSSGLPNDTHWSKDQQFAYWINAYNAFTVKLIIDNYPIESIKDLEGRIPFVNTAWDLKFIYIQGQKFDLNNIEHGILRDKFKDPRIHFAINCASISCPALRDEAYTANKINEQLDDAAKRFLLDETKNTFSSNQAKVSKIFSWFKKDFTKDQTVKDFINQYLDTPISKSTKIGYMDYDWNLNDVKE